MMKVDPGYIIYDEMRSDYSYFKDVISSQMVITVYGDDGVARQLSQGRSYIWTCDEDDDLRKWGPKTAKVVYNVCTVFDMREYGWLKMYGGGNSGDVGLSVQKCSGLSVKVSPMTPVKKAEAEEAKSVRLVKIVKTDKSEKVVDVAFGL